MITKLKIVSSNDFSYFFLTPKIISNCKDLKLAVTYYYLLVITYTIIIKVFNIILTLIELPINVYNFQSFKVFLRFKQLLLL